MILLTGITGTTGSRLLQVLAKKNIPVRAILRDPDKIKDISMPVDSSDALAIALCHLNQLKVNEL